jgi:hypothetical protein
VKIVRKKLTEQEIQRLPFPETARLLGGILVIKDTSITQADIRKLRREFRKAVKKEDRNEDR